MPALTESEGGKIKPSGYTHEFTEEQYKEIIRCRDDPIYFIENYVKIKVVKHGAMKFKLYEFQKRLIKTYIENGRSIAMLSRQCGKTATAAAFLLWWAIFKSGQHILIASKDQIGADEIMERLWFAYEELPWFIKPGTRKNDVRTKHFDNGSKIETIATTSTAGRGKSISLLYLDEFAYVPPRMAEAFWTSIFPTLSSGGNCIVTSTPNTDEDKFAQLWFSAKPSPYTDPWVDRLAQKYAVERQEDEEKYETIFETDEAQSDFDERSISSIDIDDERDDEGFVSFHAHWVSVPEKIDAKGNIVSFRDDRFKRNQLKQGITHENWMRDFECCFISGEDTLISGMKLATLRNTVRDPRFVDRWGCRWYEEILPNTPYAVVLDPSGDGVGDDAALQVWELPYLRQVAEWNDAMANQDEQVRMLKRVLNRLDIIQNNHVSHDGVDRIYYSVERNALGVGIIRALEFMGFELFPGTFIDASDISSSPRAESVREMKLSNYRGLHTTNATKKRYAQDFKQLIERNLFIVRSKFLSSQLKNFIKSKSSWGAKEGSKDDLVMCGILMCHLIDELRMQEIDLDDYVRPVIDEDDDYNVDEENQVFIPSV